MKSHKKGALNLSINAIVIIVLALTMLGLGLGFIRGMFKDITSTTGQVQEQIRQQILEDLRTGNKPLSFPVQRIKASVNEKKDLAFGVMNTGDSSIDYTIIIKRWDDNTSKFMNLSSTQKSRAGDFFWDSSPQSLKPRDANVYNVVHKVEGTSGTYMYKIEISKTKEGETPLTEPEEYASKSFFVEVS
ncbi:MAG: hypothetical protein KAU20_07245 [Nanoarchaeota archaeon]|nr:hypothetical protein [Nanoarchaeota archaeon]